ncbi:MAG: preprotein translocase subunit YajC [Rhodobacteraceae bacterium]|nr:MAG: preprotein translocase subunit YajC [Paracoccaceae bacterium]
MFATPAYAQTAAPGAGGADFFFQLIPLILIFVIFYFFLIRPQQQKAKQHKAMIDAVRRGDQIITQGGLHAKVVKVADDTVEAEIAPNVKVKVVKATIAAVVSKTEPANEN